MYLNNILRLSFKNFLMILWDIFLIFFSIKISEYLIYNNLWLFSADNFKYIGISINIFILVFSLTGQYKSITRYLSSKEIYKIFLRCLIGQFFIYITLLLTKTSIPQVKIILISLVAKNSKVALRSK